MILADFVLHTRMGFAALVVLSVLALTASDRWQALALPQVLTDIEAALPPAGQAAEAHEASLSHAEADMPDRSNLRLTR